MNSDLNHYMSKTAITRAIVEGVPGKALCGEVFLPQSQGAEAMPWRPQANRKRKTCPNCELFYGALRSDAEEKTKSFKKQVAV